jgi:hypothetical protein
MTPSVLLSSSFAQEQYITMPASQLVNMPGTYMVQVRATPRPPNTVSTHMQNTPSRHTGHTEGLQPCWAAKHTELLCHQEPCHIHI